MVAYICPVCHNGILRFQVKEGYGVDFDISKSNQKIACKNCKRQISYSVQKSSECETSKNSLIKL